MIRASLVLLLAALASPVAADPAKADQLAGEANELIAAGEFKKAAAKYTAAYREDPSRVDVFCNIGISYFKNGELPRAHLLLSQCIARSALNLKFKDTARAVVDSIDQTMREGNHTPVTIKVTPENASVFVVEFGEESKFVGDRTLWIPFGPHQVTARVEGFEPATVSVMAADQNPKEVQITLKRITPKPAIERHRKPSPSKLPPILVSGATVLAIGLAFYSSGRATEEAEAASFVLALDEMKYESFKANAQSEVDKWNRNTGIMIGVAVVAAGASAYLWYRALKTQPYLEVTPTAGGAAATFTRRF